jgi:hypothetical protein
MFLYLSVEECTATSPNILSSSNQKQIAPVQAGISSYIESRWKEFNRWLPA